MLFKQQIAVLGVSASVAVLGLLAPTSQIKAQGCVVAHSVGGVGGPDSDGGYLGAGHWQINFDYRHLYSFRHYIGSVEQVYRTEGKSNVRNRVNLFNAALTYQITPRFSVVGDIPFEFASRRAFIAAHSINGGPANTLVFDYGLSGVGDISFQGQGWLWNPKKNPSHNIQIGLGVQMPTGRDNIQNNFAEIPGQPATNTTADYSIQPGIGVWAIPFSIVSFQTITHSTQAYFNGSYLTTPAETNGVANPSPAGFPAPAPQNAKVSAADEYLMQGGFAYMVERVKGLTVTAGLRREGVPAHDLIGGNEGFRRPGYAVSFEPGVVYSMKNGHDVLTANIDRALYRNRVASVPDMQLGAHGDAAFADWLWLGSFQHRF